MLLTADSVLIREVSFIFREPFIERFHYTYARLMNLHIEPMG